MSADPYFVFVAAAYGVSALALGALAVFIALDGRTAKRDLARLERPRGDVS